MKTYLISSPAYKANGNHGTYHSIAICEDNGDFRDIIGDHRINGKCFNDYENVHQIEGVPFSDADRFISIREVELDLNVLNTWKAAYAENRKNIDKWYADRAAVAGGSLYDFIYDKKGRIIPENNMKFMSWMEANPAPLSVPYYDFLKAIKRGNIDTTVPIQRDNNAEFVTNGYFEAKNGRKLYNLYASYDAKLNIETGEAWLITSPHYRSIDRPTINTLLAAGELTDHNYGK